jgi:hypothetical protein
MVQPLRPIFYIRINFPLSLRLIYHKWSSVLWQMDAAWLWQQTVANTVLS